MALYDGNRVLDSTKPEYLMEYYQNFRYFASLIYFLPEFPEFYQNFFFKYWDCFGGVRPTVEQAGVVGGGPPCADP